MEGSYIEILHPLRLKTNLATRRTIRNCEKTVPRGLGPHPNARSCLLETSMYAERQPGDAYVTGSTSKSRDLKFELEDADDDEGEQRPLRQGRGHAVVPRHRGTTASPCRGISQSDER